MWSSAVNDILGRRSSNFRAFHLILTKRSIATSGCMLLRSNSFNILKETKLIEELNTSQLVKSSKFSFHTVHQLLHN